MFDKTGWSRQPAYMKNTSIKHDLARLCFMLYTASYGNSQLKMEILEFTSEEAAAPLMSSAAPLWFWKFWKKILDFGIFSRNFEFFENFEKYE